MRDEGHHHGLHPAKLRRSLHQRPGGMCRGLGPSAEDLKCCEPDQEPPWKGWAEDAHARTGRERAPMVDVMERMFAFVCDEVHACVHASACALSIVSVFDQKGNSRERRKTGIALREASSTQAHPHPHA